MASFAGSFAGIVTRNKFLSFSGRSADITVTSASRKCSALTGSARKLKDNAADWHNLLLRWEKLNEEGFVLAGNIVDMRQLR